MAACRADISADSSPMTCSCDRATSVANVSISKGSGRSIDIHHRGLLTLLRIFVLCVVLAIADAYGDTSETPIASRGSLRLNQKSDNTTTSPADSDTGGWGGWLGKGKGKRRRVERGNETVWEEDETVSGAEPVVMSILVLVFSSVFLFRHFFKIEEKAPRVTHQHWQTLSQEQKAAATVLGFNEHAWNHAAELKSLTSSLSRGSKALKEGKEAKKATGEEIRVHLVNEDHQTTTITVQTDMELHAAVREALKVTGDESVRVMLGDTDLADEGATFEDEDVEDGARLNVFTSD